MDVLNEYDIPSADAFATGSQPFEGEGVLPHAWRE
jgi:hypothetical protein